MAIFNKKMRDEGPEHRAPASGFPSTGRQALPHRVQRLRIGLLADAPIS